MTTGTMKWKSGPGGVAITEADVLAEAPAADDMIPVYDTSATEGKVVAKSWADRPRFHTKPAAANLTAAEMSDTVISNLGQADEDVALTLPTCAAGLRARFTVATARAKKWGVRAGSADKIYMIAFDGTVSAGSDNGYARFTNAVLGQCMEVWSFESASGAYDWMVKAESVATSALAAN